MIVDAIIGVFSTVLSAVFSVLPTFGIVSSLGLPSTGDTSSPGYIAGGYVGGFDGFIPVVSIVELLYTAFAAMLAFYAIYKIANWVWRHIPELWGFGPGSG